MEKYKRKLQFVVGFIFGLAALGLFTFIVNQINLNKDSKRIIESNNAVIDTFNTHFKEAFKSFQNIDLIKLDETKVSSLTSTVDGFEPQIDIAKNQLKPGINSPSQNNYKLTLLILDSNAEIAKNTKGIVNTRICLKAKYGDYSSVLTNIYSLQDQVGTANSFSDSKAVLSKLKSAYQDLLLKSIEIDKCIAQENLSDLKSSLSESEQADTLSVNDYQNKYLDPLIALYTSKDSAKISEFIDQNSAVSVKLKLPSLFDNTLGLCIIDRVIEDQLDSLIQTIK